jgi:hypothetical protein
MGITCENCSTVNRRSSRFCAKCGYPLSPIDETSQVEQVPQPSGEQSELDLPWLQAVTDRASKPRTERLGEASAQQSGQNSEPSQPIDPTSDAPSPTAPAATEAQPQPSGASPTQPIEETPDVSPPPDPNEPPPDWVVSILEPQAEQAPELAHEYDPEELAHIMPWVHGEEKDEAQEGTDAVAVGGLPPWLSEVTVQETLQSSPPAEGEFDPSALGLDDVQPFVPPSGEGAGTGTATHRAPEEAPDWLASITGPGERAPVEPALRRGDLSMVDVPPDAYRSTVSQPPLREIPVRSPREGSVETLAALIAPTAPEAARWAVPGVERTLEGEATGKGRGRAWFLPDGLIYLLVMSIIIAVLVARPPFGDLPAPRAEGVPAFYDAIERVASSGVVLVVYDWDASRSAEMSLLAEGITRHLMSRRLRFVTISTVPQGPGFAELVTERAVSDYPGYEYGRDYVVLGYLPGGHTGLAALMSDYRQTLPRDYREGKSVFTNYSLFGNDRLENLGSYALIITLASDEAELRSWIEQVGTRSDVPMLAAVPQGLDPVARPYLNIPGSGLSAIVSGPAGALQYAKLMEQRGLRPSGNAGLNSPTLTDRLNAQSVAALLVAGVILAALLGMIMRRKGT